MQKFLYKLLVFLMPLVFGYLIVEYINRQIPNEYTTKIKYFENSLNEIEVLIFGSSHGLRGINPKFFNDYKGFNIAMVSQPVQLDYAIFEKYKNRLTNLKVLVLTISHFSLSKDLREGEIAIRIPFYYHFYDLNTLPISGLRKYSVLPAVGYSKAMSITYKYLLSNTSSKVKTDEYGYMGGGGLNYKDSIPLQEDAIDASTRHEDFSYDFSDNLKLLNEMLLWTKSNNIQVLLIETPKTSEYANKLDPKKAVLIDSTLSMLESKYLHVTYYDFTHLYENRKYFRNSDHLNELGAKEFSLLLNKKMNELFKK